MGVRCKLRRLPDGDLRLLIEEPDAIWAYLGSPQVLFAGRTREEVAQLFADPRKLSESMQALKTTRLPGFGDFADLELEKWWNAIHYLLTGKVDGGRGPLAYLSRGGTSIGTDETHDVGYGAARGFDRQRVVEIAAALAAISPEELGARYEPKAMIRARVYPQIWADDPDALVDLLDAYELMLGFLASAVAERQGMLVIYT